MKRKQTILLFVALLLPILVFVFLKRFGKNEFNVPALYVTEVPAMTADCPKVSAPYHVSDSVLKRLNFGNDSLVLISFGEILPETAHQLKRVEEAFDLGLHRYHFEGSGATLRPWKQCVFLLKEPFDLILVDRHGSIRGQYVSVNREEIDRLIAEIAIILKKY